MFWQYDTIGIARRIGEQPINCAVLNRLNGATPREFYYSKLIAMTAKRRSCCLYDITRFVLGIKANLWTPRIAR